MSNINTEKISKLKKHMNLLLEEEGYTTQKNNIPLYLDYILNLLTTSYPFISKYEKSITRILNIVDSYYIHPYVFESLFVNLIHSSAINEIILNNNINSNFLNSLPNIQHDVAILLSKFEKIFNFIDTEFESKEKEDGYNYVSSLDYENFNKLFNSVSLAFGVDIDKKILTNVMQVQVEHMIHYDIENYVKTNEVNIDELVKSNKKFDFDINFLSSLTDIYKKSLTTNYMKVKFFDNFIDININSEDNIKNVLYFWIDYIAIINNSIFEKLLKK